MRRQPRPAVEAAADEANSIGEGLRPRPTSGLLSQPLPSGVHIVRIHEGERWSVTVTAESRHRQSSDLEDGRVRHVMGFEYADQSADTQQTLRILYERNR